MLLGPKQLRNISNNHTILTTACSRGWLRRVEPWTAVPKLRGLNPVQWRLEESKRWIPGTPWPNLETGAGPVDHYVPPAHRALWSECPSEEDGHFRHFPLWVRTSWPNPRPHPSVLPNIHRETSANMATRCWSGDQAVGLGRRPLPDGWFCGINRTENPTCTAVDHWRRPLPDGWFCGINRTEDLTCIAVNGWRRRT